MIKTDLSEGQPWVAARGFNNSFTLTFTLSGSAYNTSSYTFSLKIRRIGGTVDVITLTQSAGITNGGASGIVTIQLTKAQTESIEADSYFYQLEYVVGGLTYRLLHGTLNLVIEYDENDINPSISVPVSLAGTNVNLNITLATGNNNTRSISTTSTTTLTPNVDLYDLFVISAQSTALLIANPTGTAVLGNGFMVDIDDNGSARAITYGNLYDDTFFDLPSTTIAGKRMKMVFQYNGTNWELLNVINEQ